MFLGHRPTATDVDDFILASTDLPLSYGPIGLSEGAAPGYRIDQQRTHLGHGTLAFARARAALEAWTHFELGWVELFPQTAAIHPGTVVGVCIRHLGFWSLNGCRVVKVIDSATEFGFAYGTLTNHAESGEELFKVALDADTGEVSYLIRAASKPRAPLARLGFPYTRTLQARFRRDSSSAMAHAITS